MEFHWHFNDELALVLDSVVHYRTAFALELTMSSVDRARTTTITRGLFTNLQAAKVEACELAKSCRSEGEVIGLVNLDSEIPRSDEL